MDKEGTFPQADDFSKIEALIDIENEETLNDIDKLKQVLGNISNRQISYYISAATFIGIIEIKDKMKYFSKEIKKARESNSVMKTAVLISLILRSPVFSKVFTYTRLFGKQDAEDVKGAIKEFYPNYSEAIYKRRSQTVVSWINWINKII